MRALPFLGLMTCATLASAREPVSRADEFVADHDAWIERAMERAGIVPGLAIAVVVDDRIVLARGYGLADVEAGAAADDETLFYIASVTKSYMGLLAAELDARGTLPLSTPVAGLLDGAAFPDSLRPDEITVRDLLTHTHGIENDPIAYRLAYTGEHDETTLWGLLASSAANAEAPLGTYQYTNVGYNIYGMFLERVTGTRWQDHLQNVIFGPAGLTRTSAYVSRGDTAGWPKARPYFGLAADGIQRRYLEKDDTTMQSAGGMMTTAQDAARWLLLHVNDGVLDGERIFSEEVMALDHEPLVEAPPNPGSPLEQHAYGLGWSHGTHRDQAILSHGGGFPGFRSIFSFMPDAGIGVAVMVNEGSLGGMLMQAILLRSYDWWLGADLAEADATLDGILEQLPRFKERMGKHRAELAAREWKLSRPLSAYAGTFVSDLWGTVTIRERDGELHVETGNLHCVGTPYTKEETMRVELVPGSGRIVIFEPAEGPVERIVYDTSIFERVASDG